MLYVLVLLPPRSRVSRQMRPGRKLLVLLGRTLSSPPGWHHQVPPARCVVATLLATRAGGQKASWRLLLLLTRLPPCPLLLVPLEQMLVKMLVTCILILTATHVLHHSVTWQLQLRAGWPAGTAAAPRPQ